MVLNVIDRKIRRAFSQSAVRYDVMAGLQNEIGRELARAVAATERDVTAVLDVGMGTGRMTRRLDMMFPDALVVGLDFAPGMLEVARRKHEDLKLVLADAGRLPFAADSFDVITSNLAYQWLADPAGAFAEHARVLRPGGEFVFTLFGGRTLCELCEALALTGSQAGGGGQVPSAAARRPLRSLPALAQIETALRQSGLQVVQSRTELIKTHFPGMMELLRWLKDIGAAGIPYQGYLGRTHLRAAADYYRQTFADRWGVGATFEVLWVTAQRPGAGAVTGKDNEICYEETESRQ